MAKKTSTEKVEKGEKNTAATEKSSGDKTPAESAKFEPNEQPVELGWQNTKFIRYFHVTYTTKISQYIMAVNFYSASRLNVLVFCQR